jgi:hypothetical protein
MRPVPRAHTCPQVSHAEQRQRRRSGWEIAAHSALSPPPRLRPIHRSQANSAKRQYAPAADVERITQPVMVAGSVKFGKWQSMPMVRRAVRMQARAAGCSNTAAGDNL